MYIEKDINKLIKDVENSLKKTKKFDKKDELLLGVDLGTAYIVLVVLDSNKKPIASEMEYASVVKDGLVVDYIGALRTVKRLKEKLEDRLGVSLEKAALAIPPGVSPKDSKAHINIAEGAGLEVTNMLDEPTAANAVLNIKDGAIVDIGGGSTGISIIEDGKVVHTADEPTGGTHLSLVIAGNYRVTFEEAEELKVDSKKQKEILPIISPVIEKIASIVDRSIEGYNVENVYLVGGTCCFYGVEKIIEKELGIKTIKPGNPFLVTPLGIAMNC